MLTLLLAVVVGATGVRDLTVDGDLVVTGDSAVTGGSTVTGNATVGGTLVVTGNTTMAGDLDVTGNITGAGSYVCKSYAFRSAASGDHWVAGFYEAPAADANLSNASTTVVLGGADDEPWGAHAFAVFGGAGTTDGSDLVLTVTGTSITDAGVRVNADSEVIIGSAAAHLSQCEIAGTAATADLYCETDKKWIGQVTYTISSTGGAAFTLDFNYGYAKYEDFGNRDFTVTDFECTGGAGASNTLNIELHKHTTTGWTYSAAAFTADEDNNTIVAMDVDYSGPENGVTNNKQFAYKRAGLSSAITGSGNEGVVIEFSVGAVNTVDIASCHICVEF